MAEALAPQRRPAVSVHRADGSVLVLARSPRSRRVRRNKRAFGAGLLDFKDKLTVTEHDWACAGICALLVFGVIFFAFGLVAQLFRADSDAAEIFWLLGFGNWALAFGIFFSFMSNPYPKHRKRR